MVTFILLSAMFSYPHEYANTIQQIQ